MWIAISFNFKCKFVQKRFFFKFLLIRFRLYRRFVTRETYALFLCSLFRFYFAVDVNERVWSNKSSCEWKFRRKKKTNGKQKNANSFHRKTTIADPNINTACVRTKKMFIWIYLHLELKTIKKKHCWMKHNNAKHMLHDMEWKFTAKSKRTRFKKWRRCQGYGVTIKSDWKSRNCWTIHKVIK